MHILLHYHHLPAVCKKLIFILAPGTPEPTATWLQNGKTLQVSDDVKQSFNGRTAKLFFREVYPEDEGCYVCTAVNSEGEVSTTAMLKVKGACPVLESIPLDQVHSREKPRRISCKIQFAFDC